jgi:uncharacterized membrane protein YcjF (UPF0283 family)
MNTIWTDPRFVWVAAGTAALAVFFVTVVFTLIVWFIVSRLERRSEARVRAAELAAKEAAADAEKAGAYAFKVAEIYHPVRQLLDQMTEVLEDHADRIDSPRPGSARRVRERLHQYAGAVKGG